MSDFATMAGEVHVKIKDSWFGENENKIFWIYNNKTRKNSHTKESFTPRGIFIGSNGENGQATTAIVKGFLYGENEKDLDEWPLTLNVVHPLRFAAIYENDTDARGIKIIE